MSQKVIIGNKPARRIDEPRRVGSEHSVTSLDHALTETEVWNITGLSTISATIYWCLTGHTDLFVCPIAFVAAVMYCTHQADKKAGR